MILKNKKFIISAAGDGIGFSISKLIVENGGKVYLTDIDQQKINKILNSYENILCKLVNNLSTLRDLKKSLSNDLLTGRIRVTV